MGLTGALFKQNKNQIHCLPVEDASKAWLHVQSLLHWLLCAEWSLARVCLGGVIEASQELKTSFFSLLSSHMKKEKPQRA